jgi:hypothetical protein
MCGHTITMGPNQQPPSASSASPVWPAQLPPTTTDTREHTPPFHPTHGGPYNAPPTKNYTVQRARDVATGHTLDAAANEGLTQIDPHTSQTVKILGLNSPRQQTPCHHNALMFACVNNTLPASFDSLVWPNRHFLP